MKPSLAPAILLFSFFAADLPCATISGRVIFKGKLPAPRRLAYHKDAACPQSAAGKPVEVSTVRRSPDGGVADVFVYVKSGAAAVPASNLPPVTLDERGCDLSPRVIGVRVGQTMRFSNHDPTPHNVRAITRLNAPFNLGIPPGSNPVEHAFGQSEQMVRLVCDVHPWTTVHVGVMDHPYFSTTDREGHFRIEGLTPGKYVLAIWHETLGARQKQIKITDEDDTAKDGPDGVTSLDFEL